MSITIDELREAKAKMERHILYAVESTMKEFKDKTGLSPKGFSVHMLTIGSLAGPEEHMVQRVRADVDVL